MRYFSCLSRRILTLLFFFPTLSSELKLDEKFIGACTARVKQAVDVSPLSPSDTLVSATPLSSGKISLDEVDASKARLTDKYPNAYSDFFGCGTPCVYKSGDAGAYARGPRPKESSARRVQSTITLFSPFGFLSLRALAKRSTPRP